VITVGSAIICVEILHHTDAEFKTLDGFMRCRVGGEDEGTVIFFCFVNLIYCFEFVFFFANKEEKMKKKSRSKFFL